MFPIYINYYSDSELYGFGRYALHTAIVELRKEIGLNIRIGRKVRKISPVKVFEIDEQTRTIYIYKSFVAPVGEAEVCGNRGFAFVNYTPVGSSNLIKHEILHMLGASHYKGFVNDVTSCVMNTIKKCLHLRGEL